VLTLTASVASNGLSRSGIIWSLLALLLVSFIAFALDTWAINAVLLRVYADLDPFRFFRKILPAQLVGFSTQSSAGTLPLTTSILTEKVGVGPSVANFTASLGTTIGMPGCSGIWPVLVAVYGIHGLGLSFGPGDYVRLAVVSLIVSLGTAGVPGTSTVVTAGVLTAVGLPLEILVLVLPISAIADTGRTATNITAAMVASAVVARQEGVLDDAVFNDETDYEPAVVPVSGAADGVPGPADSPRDKPSTHPDQTPGLRAPVGEPAYAAAIAEIAVGESCPF
jgi:L-cystine uptake protein TcyP (sodium:dicarboxylate symporter family)